MRGNRSREVETWIDWEVTLPEKTRTTEPNEANTKPVQAKDKRQTTQNWMPKSKSSSQSGRYKHTIPDTGRVAGTSGIMCVHTTAANTGVRRRQPYRSQT